MSSAVSKLNPKSSEPFAANGEVDEDLEDEDQIFEGNVLDHKGLLGENCADPNALFTSVSPLNFTPIYVQSIWEDPSSKNNRISIAVLLLSGVRERAGDLRLPVDNGNLLLLR